MARTKARARTQFSAPYLCFPDTYYGRICLERVRVHMPADLAVLMQVEQLCGCRRWMQEKKDESWGGEISDAMRASITQ